MKIIVCAKQVVDVSQMKVDPATNRPILQGIPVKISDIDKNAMEEGIKLKQKLNGQLTVITLGPPTAKEKIKELLAMGADEAILVSEPENSDFTVTAQLLAAAIKKVGDVDVVLCGEASLDMYSGQVGPMVAELLSIPQATYVQKLEADADKVVAERNLGDNIVTMEVPYPVLVSVTKEINEPRLPSLMEILGAANKPIHDWTFESLEVPVSPLTETKEIRGVSMERKNMIFKDGEVDEMVKQLIDNLAKDGVLG